MTSPRTLVWTFAGWSAAIACVAAVSCGGDDTSATGPGGSGEGAAGPASSASTGGGGASSSSTVASSSSSTGGGGGEGGAGGGGCRTADQCPDPMNECVTAECIAGQCETTNVTDGTKTAAQTPADCQVTVCDGSGATKSVSDDANLPDDANPCTGDTCDMGVPTHPNLPADTVCGAGLVCDGNGACVGCTAASQCPGQDDECKTRTCIGGVCGQSFTPSGTQVQAQSTGDCKLAVCDGAGAITSQDDDTDVFDDGFECTDDICSGGLHTNPPLPAGSPCTEGGGSVCDDGGICVECVQASDCPGQDTECGTRVCNSFQCGISPIPAGTVIMQQTVGDCATAVCDGNGNVGSTPDDSDLPVDGNQCTADLCTMGLPSNPNLPAGSPCNQMGGTLCDAGGNCVTAPATCTNGVKDGTETDVDCGGGACPGCGDLADCVVAGDCLDGSCIAGKCVTVWINELHYDNVSNDAAEAVEIAGTAGVDLAGWTVVLYNGAGGQTYLPVPAGALNLTGVIPNQQANRGTLGFLAGGIQNGSPDGLALVAPGPVVVQFLSYEGAFAATNGPANTLMSIDIGVSENGTEPLGQSLQLGGTGSTYSDFVWKASPTAASLGAINSLQIFN